VPSPASARVPRQTRDLPPLPGITVLPHGIDVAVYAGHASAVALCLFEPGDDTGHTERRVPLTERAHGWWFGFVPDVGVGQRYGIRVDGVWEPETGLRHNPDRLLLDPYAKAIEGEVTWGQDVYGHAVDEHWGGDGDLIGEGDNAGSMPRCVIIDDAFDWGDDTAPAHTRSESVIYETHVRNLTKTLLGVPEELRGTYAGMAHPVTIDYLKRLGVTAVELLPIHSFTSEPAVVRRGLSNHWGYNTLGFFAPHAAYAAATEPQAVVDEVKGMVKLLHAAGIEVILDVVYNHTAEQSRQGATLSFRGLDNRAYYRLDERGRDVDVTGCGNTLDLRHPIVCRMALDSLRYWVEQFHVDGFRFDLAVALARGRGDDYDPDHPFLIGVRTDPVLSRVKLIAEPWDLGLHGWRTGQFPPPFSEWNDRYRDSVRTFWLSDVRAELSQSNTHGVQDLATRLAGSHDLFWRRDRGPIASINYVAAHDGFTIADLTAYDRKHNLANGEDNRDGSDHNHSYNHGAEGPTDDPAINARRRRSIRNLLGTLLLSTGVPMLNGGDEFGRSQGGNNNPYCQDNEISWFDWDLQPWQEDLLATTRYLTGLRRALPALRQRTWSVGRQVQRNGSLDMAWYTSDGHPMGPSDWSDSERRTVQLYVNGAWIGERSVLLVLHGGIEDATVTLPTLPDVNAYELLWDSAWEHPAGQGYRSDPLPVTVGATSLQVWGTLGPEAP
jgi:isoamylase